MARLSGAGLGIKVNVTLLVCWWAMPTLPYIKGFGDLTLFISVPFGLRLIVLSSF
ncbi:MAG: hypothetical protein RIM23_02865 [Coleofasciculus sp. G3-WIS-01]|uniref:hypothetical protein n=1 Tax=Coleofasciculus sp. G3-WIS-01 TaxID=3069528 RepID=UPI0032F4929D